MKKFFSEFKKFITRGNVLDMAVGVIVGGAFTAIVNAMSNNILKPVINWVLAKILGAEALSELFTYLKTCLTPEGGVDLEQSIYIDWGAFINAVINFLLTAFVLFCIVKTMNSFKEGNEKLANELFDGLTKEDRKILKQRKIKLKDKEAVAAYLAEKAKKAEEEKLAAEEKARLDREENPTTEDLLKAILAELQNKQ